MLTHSNTWGFSNISFSSFRSGKRPRALRWQSAHSSPGQAGERKECKSNNRNGLKWICRLQINFSRRYTSIISLYGWYHFIHLFMSSDPSYFDQYLNSTFPSGLSVSPLFRTSIWLQVCYLNWASRVLPKINIQRNFIFTQVGRIYKIALVKNPCKYSPQELADIMIFSYHGVHHFMHKSTLKKWF